MQHEITKVGPLLDKNGNLNEPGYAKMSGTRNGEVWSLKYNEDTFILSVRTMMYTMKKPPKVHFLYISFKPFFSFLGVQATDLSHFVIRILKNLLWSISTTEHMIFWRHVKRTWKAFKLVVL